MNISQDFAVLIGTNPGNRRPDVAKSSPIVSLSKTTKGWPVKNLNTVSNHREISKISMKNRLRFIVTGALLLAATSVTAGLLSSPMGVLYTYPELAPVDIKNIGNGKVQIRTTGLTGEMTLQGSDFPPEFDIATTAKVVLPFEQAVIFDIDYADGIVSGRSTAKFYDASSSYLAATAEVRGNATCLPLNGLECGQLVVDLELQGVVSDPNNPAIVGRLQMDVLASFYFDGSDVGLGSLAAMSANATIGGNEGMINSLTGLSGGDAVQM